MLREWRAAGAFSVQTSVSWIVLSRPHLGGQQCEQCVQSCTFAGCNLLPAQKRQSASAMQHMHACCPRAYIAAAGLLSAGPS